VLRIVFSCVAELSMSVAFVGGKCIARFLFVCFSDVEKAAERAAKKRAF
jgi:hypothetical protein